MGDYTPDQIARAREAAASVRPYSHNSALILDGERDGTDIVQSALAAIAATEAHVTEKAFRAGWQMGVWSRAGDTDSDAWQEYLQETAHEQ